MRYFFGQNAVAVDDAGVEVAFTDTMGGTGDSFKPRVLKVTSAIGSDPAYVNLAGGTPTTDDLEILEGETYTFDYDNELTGDGFETITAICDTGETATLKVFAAK